MSLLTVQLDLRLRRLGPDGLEDVVATFSHYDLPPQAAGGDWSHGDRPLLDARVVAQFLDVIETIVPQLLDHCAYEQAELPFP